MTTTTEDEFGEAPPAPQSQFFTPSNHIGSLVLFFPYDYDEKYTNKWGDTKATIWADVYVLRGEGAGAEFLEAEISNFKLASQLKQRLGGMVLGRLDTDRKAVVITAPRRDDLDHAREWKASNSDLFRKDRSIRTRATAEATGPGMPPPPPVRNDQPPF